MRYVKDFDFFGDDIRQVPCLTGNGAPAPSTAVAVGILYMDTGTGKMYKCTATGVWEDVAYTSDVPPNLLHNSYFPEAVNQRGKSSYTGKVQYTIDRWKTTNANTTVDVLEDGIRLTNAASGGGGYLQQTLENPEKRLGKTFTLAAMQTNGTLTVASAKLPDAFPSAITQYATLMDNGVTVGAIQVSTNSVWVRLWSNPNETTRSFRWALLHEGIYTIQHYVPKHRALELYDCMRFYQLHSTSDVQAVDMRPQMRLTNPTITALDDGTYAYSADL